MKKQRLNRNNGESTLTNSTGKKKPFNAHGSQISSTVNMSEEQIWINASVEHLFKVRRNKNWYFIQNSF